MSEFPEAGPEPTPEDSQPTAIYVAVPPDPAPIVVTSADLPPEPAPRRVPNIGHAVLFVATAAAFLFAYELIIFMVWGPPAAVHGGVTTILHPKLQLLAEAVTYLATLVLAWLLFPLFWHRTFAEGVRWHWSTARNQATRLIPLGLTLGILSAVVDYFVTTTKPPPIEDFFVTASDAWILTFFGILVAPAFEEICFRGFLLPAFAIAWDWLRLPRTDDARRYWITTTSLSPTAYIVSAVVTSLLFAGLHAQQVAYTWSAMIVLFSVSLVLTFVRVKTQSVAASTLVHASYNSFIFLITILQTSGYRHLDRMTK
jgi:membrane protease YdiL (CAAX protease family)